MNRKTLVLPAVVGTVAALLAACQSGSGGSGSGNDDDRIVVGTTDSFAVTEASPAPLDPAAAHDVSSWNILRNTFQTLLRLPRSGTEPEMDAAKKCGFADRVNEQYRCTLRSGLTFSDGKELTAKDVEFSIRRVLAIDYENGPASLLSNIDTVEAIGDSEVVFHLKSPDATFPHKLTTPATAIVNSAEYPARELAEGLEVKGSGPYVLKSFDAGAGRAVLTRNTRYQGGLAARNEQVELRFFKTSEEMEKALKSGSIDVMNRNITPDQVSRLESAVDDDVSLFEARGQEIRHLFFGTGSEPVREQAVRQAVAQVIDRQALVRDVYRRTAEPLYSLVPAGLTGHRNSFFNAYGEPDVTEAGRTLSEAGVKTPVPLRLTYTDDHYGPAAAEEFGVLRQQLNASGLFEVTVEGVPWSEFRPAAVEGKYAAFGMSWFPDYPDPDNYIAPFFTEEGIFDNPYENSEIQDELIPEIRRTEQRSEAVESFIRAQDIVAEEVPLIPLWQGKQYVAARDDITGAEWALSSSATLQLWELGRSARK